MENEKKIRIKKLISIALLPIPVIAYLTAEFILKVQRAEYVGFASLFIIILLLVLLKIELVVSNETGKRKIHFSFARKKAEHQATDK